MLPIAPEVNVVRALEFVVIMNCLPLVGEYFKSLLHHWMVVLREVEVTRAIWKCHKLSSPSWSSISNMIKVVPKLGTPQI